MISVRAVHLLKLPVSAGSSESYRRKHRANLNFIFRCPLCDVLSLIQLAVMNQENQIAVNHDHQDPKIPNSDRIRTRTWRFDLTLRVPPLSGQEDVLQVVRSILNKAHDNLAISGLDQSSFSVTAIAVRGKPVLMIRPSAAKHGVGQSIGGSAACTKLHGQMSRKSLSPVLNLRSRDFIKNLNSLQRPQRSR